jgi:hypothetical protein
LTKANTLLSGGGSHSFAYATSPDGPWTPLDDATRTSHDPEALQFDEAQRLAHYPELCSLRWTSPAVDLKRTTPHYVRVDEDDDQIWAVVTLTTQNHGQRRCSLARHVNKSAGRNRGQAT